MKQANWGKNEQQLQSCEGSAPEVRTSIINEVVERNWPLALSVAGKFIKSHDLVPQYGEHDYRLDEVYSSAAWNFLRSAYRWSSDHKSGAKFSSYAIICMRRPLSADVFFGHPLLTNRNQWATWNELREMACSEGLELPNEDTIWRWLKKKHPDEGTKAHKTLSMLVEAMSLERVTWDEPAVMDDEDESDTLADLHAPPSDSDNPLQEIVEERELEDFVRKALGTLAPREEKVIRMRFGIGERRDHVFEEIGRQFGLTRESIRQIEAKGLAKLRRYQRRELRAYESQTRGIPDPHESARCRAPAGVYVTEVGYLKRSARPKPADAPIETKLRGAVAFTQDDEELLAQLFGWFGRVALSLQEIAAQRETTVAAVELRADKLTRRMRQLGIWEDAPRFVERPKPMPPAMVQQPVQPEVAPAPWGAQYHEDDIIAAVLEYYKLTEVEFVVRKEHVFKRGMLVYLLMHMTELPRREIASFVGFKSWQAASYWFVQIGYRAERDANVQQQLDNIRRLIAQKKEA